MHYEAINAPLNLSSDTATAIMKYGNSIKKSIIYINTISPKVNAFLKSNFVTFPKPDSSFISSFVPVSNCQYLLITPSYFLHLQVHLIHKLQRLLVAVKPGFMHELEQFKVQAKDCLRMY